MIPEHCLHLIFFPTRAWATFVCHLQVGQTTERIAPVEAGSGICPRTMGAAAFLGALACGNELGEPIGLGGGVNWAVELAGGALDSGAGATGGGGTGAFWVAGMGAGGVDEAGAGAEAGEAGIPLPTGMVLPHFGHFTSVGILAGIALIFSFALQPPHSMGINSIPFSFVQSFCPVSTSKSVKK